MNVYGMVQTISEKTGVEDVKVDLILKELTNTLNDDILNGGTNLSSLIKLIRKKEGLDVIKTKITETTSLPGEDVDAVVTYMINSLGSNLKTNGVKGILNVVHSIKKSCKKIETEIENEAINDKKDLEVNY